MGGVRSTYWERIGVYSVLVGKTEERDHLEYPCIDGRLILRWVSRKCDVGAWNGSIWFRIGTGSGNL